MSKVVKTKKNQKAVRELKLDPEQKRKFKTRPKSVREMFSLLMKVGIDPMGLELGFSQDSHSAPLGKPTHWSKPMHLPAFNGLISCKRVKGFNYQGRGYPWDRLWWAHSGTGGTDGVGNGQFGFTIWCADVPEVTAEWAQALREWEDAKSKHRLFMEKIGREVSDATHAIYQRHQEEISAAHTERDRATEAFDVWKNGMLKV